MNQIKLNIDNELAEVSSKLKQVSADKWPEILRDAVNETGFYALNKIKREMPNFIDRPKPYTINSMFLKKANTKDIDATIQWRQPEKKSSGGQYLKPIVYGQDRKQKGFERELQARGLMPSGWFALPSDNIKRDPYGNVPAGFFRKILIQLGAASDAIQRSQAKALIKKKGIVGAFSAGSNDKKARDTGVTVFAAIQGRNGQHLPSGIYERRRFGFGSALRLLFSFIPRMSYDKTFPFDRIASDAVRAKFSSKVDEAISKRVNKSQ